MRFSVLFLLVFLSSVVSAGWFGGMDYYEGQTYKGEKVYLNTSWSLLEVTPHTAFSAPGVLNFTQKIKVCNNDDQAGYFFLDYYFQNPLLLNSLKWENEYTNYNTYQDPIESCEQVGDVSKGTNQTVCSITGYSNRTVAYSGKTVREVTSDIQPKYWGNVYHYVLQKGEYLEAKGCRDYSFNFKPSTRYGKYNVRVFGNPTDDWSCVEKEDCNFLADLDPAYTTNLTYKRQINITNNAFNISNHTQEIIFTSSNFDFSHVQADFDDVLFVNFDETQQLGAYKESANTTHANFSVLIPNFTNQTATSIWVYYGNSTTANLNADCQSGYMLCDLMNGTSINQTIWNQLIGNIWTASNGYYQSATTAGQACDYAGISGNNVAMNCSLIANTSGVLKTSNSFQIEYSNDINSAACGFEVFGANGTGSVSNLTIGTVNFTFVDHDQRSIHNLLQNATNIYNDAVVASQAHLNYSLRKSNNGTAHVYEYWDNQAAGTGGTLARRFYNTTTPNTFLNWTTVLMIAHNDFSGGTACTEQTHEFKVRSYLTGTAPTISVGQEQIVNNNMNFTNNNETWSPTVYETGLANFTVNVSISMISGAFNGIGAVNFSYNGIVYHDSQITNSTNGNESVWNISIRPDLVTDNATVNQFNWTFLLLSNTTNETGSTNNRTQTVLWASYPSGEINLTKNVTETMTTQINWSRALHVFDSGSTFLDVLDWNLSNLTGTALYNVTNLSSFQVNVSTGFLSSGYNINVTVNVTPFVNVTFNGTTKVRNLTRVNNTQQVNKMTIHDCVTTPSLGYANFSNYRILDLATSAAVSATTTFDCQVWNNTRTDYRANFFTVSSNATPQNCMIPQFSGTSLNYSCTLTVSATGYETTNLFIVNQIIQPTYKTNTTIYLLSSTGLTNVTINVVDENDNPIENATITIEIYNLTGTNNYTLIASGKSDFQGQKQFALDLNRQYRINISDEGELYTLTNGNLASVGPFTILTTSLTFQILLGESTSLVPFIHLRDMAHNLTFTNSTDVFNLQYYDPSDYASQVCLVVYLINSTANTELGANCSTATWASLNYDIGNATGVFQAKALANSTEDGNQYQFDSLTIYRPVGNILGDESIWVIAIIGTMAAIGMYTTGGNPTGAIGGAMLGLGISSMMGLVFVSWPVFMGLGLLAGSLIWMLRT